MPILLYKSVNADTKLGIWTIAEPETFFSNKIMLQRTIAHPQKRLQHFAGRYLLSELYPAFPQHLIEIAHTRKPFLKDDQYHFSISHCADMAAVCVSTVNRVGIDVEKITSKTVLLRNKYLNEGEKILFPGWVARAAAAREEKTAIDTRILCHTSLWSAKEALYKWYGAGKVDFRQHINIVAWHWTDAQHFTMEGYFSLPVPRKLVLHGMVLEDAVVVYVVS